MAALIAEPSLEKLSGPKIVTKARYIKDQGNRAAHDSGKKISAQDGASTVRELFHVCYWIAQTYATGTKPDPTLKFEVGKLEKTLTITASTVEQIKNLGDKHAATQKVGSSREARKVSEEGPEVLEEELANLRSEMAAACATNDAVTDAHDYDETTTRDAFIDLLLTESGWPLDKVRDREFPVERMPSQSGNGFVDCVLWGDDAQTTRCCKSQAYAKGQPDRPTAGKALCRSGKAVRSSCLMLVLASTKRASK